MLRISDASSEEHWPKYGLKQYTDRSILRYPCDSRGLTVGLACFVHREQIQILLQHRRKLTQPEKKRGLKQKVLVRQQLVGPVRSQAQRPSQAEGRKSHIAGRKRRTSRCEE